MAHPIRPWHSLRAKLAILVTLLLGASFLVLSYIQIDQALQTSKASIEASSKAFAELSVKTLGNYYTLYYQSGYPRYVSLTKEVLELQPAVTRVRVVGADGAILGDSSLDTVSRMSPPSINEPAVADGVLQAAEDGTTAWLKEKGSQFTTTALVPYESDFGSRPFSLEYHISYDAAEQGASQARWLILAVTLSIALISIVTINWVVGRTILDPIGELIDYAEDVAKGDFQAELKLKTGDELESLATAVHYMSQNLGRSIVELRDLDEAKNEFIMIASHNLRTPLTTLRGYLPLLSDSANLSVKERKQSLVAMGEAFGQLNHLVEELLSVVSLRQTTKTAFQPVVLTDLVHGQTEALLEMARTKRVAIMVAIAADLTVMAEPRLLAQAVGYVIDNAVKFSHSGGEVRISAVKTRGHVELLVEDDGVGLDPAQKDRLFQMFKRGTSVLTYDYQGVGLGLYITRLILDKFGAKLDLASELGHGTRVTVTFPRGA